MIAFTILGEPTLMARFMAKVAPEAISGCWLWTGAPGDNQPNGQYGRFRIHGVQLKAHRVSWLLHKGGIEPGLQVLHHCDNPACVRPDHLFLGTNLDNIADRVAKGRTGWRERRGDDHPLRKLNEQVVRGVRMRVAAGERQADLARELQVHPATICEIVSRRKWKHLT